MDVHNTDQVRFAPTSALCVQSTDPIVQSANKAFVLHPGGSFAFEERIIPALLSERDVIVRIAATGLCGSDVSPPE